MTLTLKGARVNNGMTQEEVAKALGVSRKSVGEWEKNSKDILPKNLYALSGLYGVSVDDFKLG